MSDGTRKTPVARSPIHPPDPTEVDCGWIVSRRESHAPVRLSDASPTVKVVVKSDRSRFDLAYGRARWEHQRLVIGSSPGEWTIIGPPGEPLGSDALEAVDAVDITHGRALVRLTGEAAPRVLEKVCAIDLSEPMCPNLAAFRASVANVVTDVVRDDREGTRSYLLSCERSSGQFLFDAILDAGAEFGIDVEGFQVWCSPDARSGAASDL